MVPALEIDGELMLSDITLDTVYDLRSLSPFGNGNPEPLFCAHSLSVLDSRVVGDRHLKLRVKQDGIVMDAIGFGLSHRVPIKGEIINMVFTPDIDQWQGYKKVQLKMIDLEVKGQGAKLIRSKIIP
jgi:single-stranded-DNA-specific exonuclease